MKNLIASLVTIFWGSICFGQDLTGTWQLTREETCFQSEMKESDTERELKEGMGASRQSVVRMITFTKKGFAEAGIFSAGKKKVTDPTKFKYQVVGSELQFLDKKSGMATQRYIIDELTDTVLRYHNVLKVCEVKIFTRIE